MEIELAAGVETSLRFEKARWRERDASATNHSQQIAYVLRRSPAGYRVASNGSGSPRRRFISPWTLAMNPLPITP